MKKALALVLAGAMSAGLLAGCGSTAASSKATSEAASSQAAASSAAGHTVNTTDPITLTMSWWGGDARQAAYQSAIQAFETKYPNITVEANYGAWSGWEEAQSTALAAGTAADVMQVNWNWLYQYSPQGQSFIDLNDYSDVIDLTQFPQNALDACVVNDELQCIPVSMTGRIFYWNMTSFKAAGLDSYPKTLDELLAAGKTFQEKLGDDSYPLVLGAYDRMILMTFYLESKYGKAWVVDNKLNFTADEITDGFNFIKSLEDNHVIPTVEKMKATGVTTYTDSEEWISGKWAGLFTWDSSALSSSQSLPATAEFVVGDEIKLGDKANGGFSKVSMGLSVTTSCKHPTEAAALINFLLNEQEGASIMGTQCGLVTSKAGQEYAKAAGAVNDMILDANTKVMAFVDQPLDPYYESSKLKDETTGVYTDAFEGFSYGDYTVDQAVSVLMDGVNSVLAKS